MINKFAWLSTCMSYFLYQTRKFLAFNPVQTGDLSNLTIQTGSLPNEKYLIWFDFDSSGKRHWLMQVVGGTNCINHWRFLEITQ